MRLLQMPAVPQMQAQKTTPDWAMVIVSQALSSDDIGITLRYGDAGKRVNLLAQWLPLWQSNRYYCDLTQQY